MEQGAVGATEWFAVGSHASFPELAYCSLKNHIEFMIHIHLMLLVPCLVSSTSGLIRFHKF